MSYSSKPETLEHLFWMSQGTGAYQHFNYYLQHYTDYELITHREDVGNIGAVYCMVNRDRIVRKLAFDIFSVDLEFIKQ